MSKVVSIITIFSAFLIAAGCGGGKKSDSGGGTPSFAFITNGVADFWEHAQAGAEAAGEDLASTSR